jgi:heme-degrading monooxygenase HmoA
MIFVLFEVTIKNNCMDNYLAIAANLKDELMKNKGFIRSERFSSLVNERKLLSLSVWESEEAVRKWRNQTEHRIGQQQGRDSIFESYTITVTSKIRSYSNIEREEAPKDSNKIFGDVK